MSLKKLSKVMVGTAVLALGIANSAPVLAASITFTFSGVVNNVDNVFGLFDDSVQIGTPIRGSYTFNSATPDGDPSDNTFGIYRNSQGHSGLSFSVGNYTFGGNDISIRVTSRDSSDGSTYGLVGSVKTNDPFKQDSYLHLVLPRAKQDVFSSDSLPLTPPDLELFTDGIIYFDYNYLSGFGSFSGTVNSLKVAAVPEPSSVLGILVMGACGAGLLLKYKKI